MMKGYLFLLAVLTFSMQSCNQPGPVISDPVAELVASGFNFTEGPVWLAGEGLLFSDIPENKVYLLGLDSAVSEYLRPSGKSNGLSLNRAHQLVLCQHFDRQVGVFNGDSILPLATKFNGIRLNSPNDLTIKSDGTIFFTDPPFGLQDEGGTSETGYAGIYSIGTDGTVRLLDSTLQLPNGITLTKDESKLYVVECEPADIYVWDVLDDNTIANKRLFYNLDTHWGDGMKVDANDFLYATAENGLNVISPQGELIYNIDPFEANVTNCAWGSQKSSPELYLTSGSNVYRVRNR